MTRLGTASADITPPVGVELAGYGRGVPSEGVRDRLAATSFFVTDGERAVSLTAVELAGLDVAMAAAVRDAVAAPLGIDRAAVMLLATHTHSGPFFVPVDQLTEGYLRRLPDVLVDVAVRAAREPVPCRVTSSAARVAIGRNRREPDGAVDDRLGVLRFDGERPLGVLAVATAHANVLTSNVVSGDFPGAARRRLEAELGCPALIAIGGAGDVDPLWRGGDAALDRLAGEIAGAALGSPVRGGPARVSAASLSIDADLAEVGDPQRLAEEVERERGRDPGPWLALIGSDTRSTIPIEVAAVRIGDFVLGGVPLEVFSATALAAAGTDTQFLCGCANGYLGYLPTAEAFERGGYEVHWSPVVYGPATGLIRPLAPETAARVAETFARLAPAL